MQDVLANLLLSFPPLRAMVDDRIDWDATPQGQTGPRIVMFVISDPRTYTSDGQVNHFMTRVQFDCRANTALERRLLGEALDALLSGFRGEFEGVRFDGLFKDGHNTRFDSDGPDQWFTAQIDYRIFWAPAQP